MKAVFLTTTFTALVMLLPVAARASGQSSASGGPWADDAAPVAMPSDAPVNQGRVQSQERIHQAQSADREQLNRSQQQARDALQRNLERQRQESSQEADFLRGRANPSGYQPHH